MEGDVCFEKLSGGTKGKAMACEAVWWWESLILFGMYFGYCFVMYKNQDMQNWIKAKTEGGDEVATDAEKGETEGLAAPEAGLGRTASRTAAAQLNPDTVMDGKLSMHYTSTWRAGIWSVLMNKQSLARPALLPPPPRRPTCTVLCPRRFLSLTPCRRRAGGKGQPRAANTRKARQYCGGRGSWG